MALLTATCHSLPAGSGRPAGVLLVVADDHGQGDVGVYGHPVVRTPALDALAAEGMRFDGVRAVTAICQPSRATLLTGLHPISTGVFGFYPLKEGVRTLPLRLSEAGFFCGLVGKRHLQPFEAFGFEWSRERSPAEGREESVILGDTRAYLDELERRGRPPFFLMVALFDAHRPFPRPGGIGMELAVLDPLDPARVPVPPYLFDVPGVREEVAAYLDAVGRADRVVGGVLAELEHRRLARRTLVIYTADHGPAFPFAKTTAYDAGLAVPFLVRWPDRVRPGTTSGALASFVDVAPTLLDLLGVSGEGLEGASFAPVLLGERRTHRSVLFASQTDHLRLPSRPIRSIRTARYHYVLNLFGERQLTIEAVTTPTWRAMEKAAASDEDLAQRMSTFLNRPQEELFDLEADPLERENLALDPGLADVRQELGEALLSEMRALDDPLLHVAPSATDADRERSRAGFEAWNDLQALRQEIFEQRQ